jgi:integrase
MSFVNVNKQITIVAGLFDWLGAHYDSVTSNPFVKATIAMRASARDERDPFTLGELSAIFHAPLYIGCESELHWTRTGSRILRESAKFWVPLLGLYTGARLNEICKLRVADVRQEDGVHYIDINEVPHSDEKIDPRIKSAASSRQVPIHPDLVQFGFLLFVQKRRSDDTERLFPELKPDRYGKLSDGFGKHFARFLQSLGIKRDKIDFHSFRHTWTDACRNSRISSDVIYALKGEALKGTLARYGDGKTDLEILDQEVRKLRLKGLDLSHLAEDSRVFDTPSPPLTEMFG